MTNSGRVLIVVTEVGGEKRVSFDGLDTMSLSDAVLREEEDEAWMRYTVEDLPDGTELGEIVVKNGEYEQTNWFEVNYP